MKIRYITVAAFLAFSALTSQGIKAESTANQQLLMNEASLMSTDDYEFWQIKAIVKFLLADYCNIDYEDISDEHFLMNDLGLDSIDMLAFTTNCFEYFHISANPDLVLLFPDLYTVFSYSQLIYNLNPS